MELLAIISMLALIEFIIFGFQVGGARSKYGIDAPATGGNEMFERYYRVHYNTLEQLIVFLPSLWVFGYYVGQFWAAGLGVVYLIGRVIYAVLYIKEPARRAAGVLISMLPCWILVLGGLVGACWRLFGA
ncbi:MAG: MAPEG family protein [Pseudomonadales bacterium]